MNNVEKLVKLLIEKNLKISCAESCTGGMLAASLVGVEGVSEVLDASFITYANEAKTKYANVNPKTIELYGAVSEQVAGEMAQGVAFNTGADVAISVSGLAGPSGGSKAKPVGMVCFGYYVNGKLTTETVQWGDKGRNTVRKMSTDHAIDKVIQLLEEQ